MKARFFLLTCLFFLIASCNNTATDRNNNLESKINDEGKISQPIDIGTNIIEDPKINYDHTTLLAKTSKDIELDFSKKDFNALGIKSLSNTGSNSDWKIINLMDGVNSKQVINKIRNSNFFKIVDFNYIYSTQEISNENSSANTLTNNLPETSNFQEQIGVDKAWEWLENNGHKAGGDSDVVVAVIDTGVDYNHADLQQNIWINKGEIPDNGIDDDGNGYVDDVYGWNFVSSNNDPMDDNGHGTHVAGIIGAANNDFGVTGIAYNSKIMAIKAGNSSGNFKNSDIASAINYAYANGADVINMSFGGSTITMAVQEALERAYSSCFLVAAAGNNGLKNEKTSWTEMEHIDYETIYPAAFSFVDGVMSVGENNIVSSFSNWDVVANNKIEYNNYAPGESIYSTFPNNKYVKMSGTSMATPVVAGIAALLRSAVKDKNEFSSKFLMSQLNLTSSVTPVSLNRNGRAMVVDAIACLKGNPKPELSLYDWYTFDNEKISLANNNNGNIDSGETIHLGIELFNRGGMAKNISVKIDTKRNNDSNLVDPYVEIIKEEIHLSDVGTFSIRDAGKILNSSTIEDVENPLIFKVASNTPNNYQCNINLTIEWENALDKDDLNKYHTEDIISVTFHKGEILPYIIDTNTTLTSDKLWIVNDTVTVKKGVCLTIEPGTTIQFYDKNQTKYQYATPKIVLEEDAHLISNGEQDKTINFTLCEGFEEYLMHIEFNKDAENLAQIQASYTEFLNLTVTNSYTYEDMLLFNHCFLKFHFNNPMQIINGSNNNAAAVYTYLGNITNSYVSFWNNKAVQDAFVYITYSQMANSKIVFSSYWHRVKLHASSATYRSKSTTENNLFLLNDDKNLGNEYDLTISDGSFKNNCFISNKSDNKLSQYPIVTMSNHWTEVSNNVFYRYPLPFIERTFADGVKNEISSTIDLETYWPFISSYKFTNASGEENNTFSKELMNLELNFNRKMDIEEKLNVTFGSSYPYTDYIIKGKRVNETKWQGSVNIPTAIENGNQKLNVKGGRAKDDLYLTNSDNCNNIEFNIDTSSALAMNMYASASKDGINLEMEQNDYDTVMGYNIYRSDSSDGEYFKINSTLVIPEDNTSKAKYLDRTIEPGKTYYYAYTAVLSDFSESHASGRTVCTALDTISPIISHTPVNQGYIGSSLIINCIINDNVKVDYAYLYYRTKGESIFKNIVMKSENNKYFGVIPASELSINGIEYYIESSDGINVSTVGFANSPYEVMIKKSSEISYLGDVDGNGVIEAKDAMFVLQHINGKRILVNDEFRRADLNKNKVLESFEALAILQYVNGNRTNLEV